MITPPNLLIHPNLKENNFDLLRLLLAVLVLYSHCYVIYYGSMDREPLKVFSHHQAEFGTLSVFCFFIISGFLILRSFERSSSNADYSKKRVLRIVPGFVVAFLFSLFIAGPLGTIDAAHPVGNWTGYFSNLNLKRFVVDLLTLQAPHSPGCFESLPLARRVNSSMWTIQQEAICYFLVPVLAMAGFWRQKRMLLLFFAAVFGIMMLLDLPQAASLQEASTILFNYPGYTPRLMVYFLAGSCCYLLRKRMVRSWWLALLCIAGLLATARLGGFGLLFPFAGTYLLFYIAFHPRLCFPNFARKGDLSYGTYLYAWPVQQLTLYFLKDQIGLNLFFLISLAGTLVFALLSWYFIERPFLRLKEKSVSNKKAQEIMVAAK